MSLRESMSALAVSEEDELMLDRVLGAVRREAAPPIDFERADQMVQRAMRSAQTRHRRVKAATAIAAAFAIACSAAAIAVLAVGSRPDIVAEPLELVLPTGEHVTATAGAHFTLAESTEAERGVVLDDGTMLFVVPPLPDGTEFVVSANGHEIRVLGTVFAVETGGDDTVVRVFEGRVEVTDAAGGSYVVRSGEERGSDGVRAIADDAPLVREGRRAARERESERVEQARRDQARRLREVEEPIAPEPIEPLPVEPQPSDEELAQHLDQQQEENVDPAPSRPVTRVAPIPAPPPGALEDARRALVQGDARTALSLAQAPAARGAAWRLVEGDALRALRRFDEAATAYEAAASAARGTSSKNAAYLAARLRARECDDPDGALAVLDAYRVDVRGSPLEERGLALRAQILVSASRASQAQIVARRYLERFPDGGVAPFMRSLVDGR